MEPFISLQYPVARLSHTTKTVLPVKLGKGCLGQEGNGPPQPASPLTPAGRGDERDALSHWLPRPTTGRGQWPSQQAHWASHRSSSSLWSAQISFHTQFRVSAWMWMVLKLASLCAFHPPSVQNPCSSVACPCCRAEALWTGMLFSSQLVPPFKCTES